MESRADRRTSHALHTVTTHDHASDRPGYFIGELRLSVRPSFDRPELLGPRPGEGAATFRIVG